MHHTLLSRIVHLVSGCTDPSPSLLLGCGTHLIESLFDWKNARKTIVFAPRLLPRDSLVHPLAQSLPSPTVVHQQAWHRRGLCSRRGAGVPVRSTHPVSVLAAGHLIPGHGLCFGASAAVAVKQRALLECRSRTLPSHDQVLEQLCQIRVSLMPSFLLSCHD